MLYHLLKQAPRFLIQKKERKFDPLGYYDRKVYEALLFAINRVKDVTRFDLVRMLDRGDVQGAVDLLRWDEGEDFLWSVIPQHLRGHYELSAQRATRNLQSAGINARFDLVNPRAVEFVRNRSAELIRQFNRSSQDGVREIIRRGFEDGIPVRKMTRLLIEDGIGLTKRDAKAVMNLRRRLERDTELDLSDAQLNARVDKYAKQLVRQRAEHIARTEVIRAEREGTQESWRQAADEGLLDVRAVGQEWIASTDGRECEECLELDGQKRRFGEQFQVGGETFDGPPAHPSCRCALGIAELEDAP